MKVTFKIEYRTEWGESLALSLGDRKYPMEWNEGAVWSVSVDADSSLLCDYTYLVMRDGLIVRTEWDHHSSEASPEIVDSWIDCPIPGCEFPRRHIAGKFDRPGFRGAGVAIPVFSLRSGKDFGIGEFRDLHALVDWAAATGQTIIQLLPVTDTTRKGDWKDSYPYSPVSSFALHPLYIHLQDLGVEEDEEFLPLQKELNALPEIDYPRVFKAKMGLMRKAFDKAEKELVSSDFHEFCRKNSYWLDEYSSFCARRDGDTPDFWRWVQFHLDRQFSEEAAYARSLGISFKGDLPIGVSADSADAFFHPELFNLDSSAGAPPDFFSADGQNWGFPTYNWDEMAKDDYKWWKSRLRKMAEYFDAFRIDHILGFFRIWEIPATQWSGQMGHFNPALPYTKEEIEALGLPLDGLFLPDPRHEGCYQPMITPTGKDALEWDKKARFEALHTDFFYHRHDGFWRRSAERKLPELLGATGMLACGEDLGMVPDCVPGVMDHEKILSLEMVCMDKGRYWPRLSVCATSSHDLPTLRMEFARNNGRDPEPWEVRNILWNHLSSESMLAIFPLQDWVALDRSLRLPEYGVERINEPADPAHHWRYRFHVPVEKLKFASALNAGIEGLLKDSGRYLREQR
ncbi:MAG: 4-alpha-glucanotransferase [Bacteroidales bacterium]|nr:4-alpha-glucanotransferase [Bacteroidales bacterium]